MYDPSTLIYSLYIPYTRIHLLDIWHVDPETDGSDDSCGWFAPKLTEAQKEKIESIVKSDHTFVTSKPMTDFGLVFYAWTTVATVIHKRKIRSKGLSQAELQEITWLAHNPFDGFVGVAREPMDKRDFRGFIYNVYRSYLRHHRKWWQHPRWHIHHWKIVVTPILKLKRMAFTKCCKCGGRFKYGESPTTANWHSDGPKWFKSETGMYHLNCTRGEINKP